MNDVRSPSAEEEVVLGCLLDKADLVFPLTLAEHIVDALREAGMLKRGHDK